MSLVAICSRCHLVPCVCTADHLPPEYQPLEGERDDFEAYMRTYYPERSLERYGHTYKDDKVRNRWIGWCGKARFATVRVVARRAA